MVSNCRHQTLSRVLGIKSQDDVPTSTERESNDHTKKKGYAMSQVGSPLSKSWRRTYAVTCIGFPRVRKPG